MPTNATVRSTSEYRHDLTPSEYYETYVRKWVENENAEIVGGCCGIFPEHIEHISMKILGGEQRCNRNDI